MIKNALILLITLIGNTLVNAQTSLEKFTFDNKEYNVYPYAFSCTPSKSLLKCSDLKYQSNKQYIFNTFYGDGSNIPVNGQYQSEEFKEDWQREWLGDIPKKANKKFILQHQNKFFYWRNDLDRTITPALETLPDGWYVQFYEGFVQIEANGMIMKYDKQPAGFFQLQNNLPHGFAFWLSPAGDTIQKGYFDEGQRKGNWEFSDYSKELDFWSWTRDTKNMKIPFPDLNESIQYEKGMKNGPYLEYRKNPADNKVKILRKGHYKHDELTGEWFEYRYHFIQDTMLLQRHYTYADMKTAPVVKQVVLREQIMEGINTYSDEFKEFDISRLYDFENSALNIYRLNDQEENPEEGLELPEEITGSFDLEDEVNDEGDFAIDDWREQRMISEARWRDSLGIRFRFTGDYEIYHDNGKLMFKYRFENGRLVKEDTIFWDNGQAANIVSRDSSDQGYTVDFYDRNGKKIKRNFYNSLGDIDEKKSKENETVEIIDGLRAQKLNLGYTLYSYDMEDSLINLQTSKSIIYKSWYQHKKPLAEVTYDPIPKHLDISIYSINNKEKNRMHYEFGENFAFVSGKSTTKYKNLRIESIYNGGLQEWLVNDTAARKFKNGILNDYELTSDNTLYFDDQVFNGEIVFEMDQSNSSVKLSEKSIVFKFAKNNGDVKFYAEANKILEGKKAKNNDLFDVVELGSNPQRAFLEFYPQLQSLLYPSSSENYGRLAKKKYGVVRKTKGKYVNGKPDGNWVSYDVYGKPMVEMNFVNGELDGKVSTYSYAFPFEIEVNDPMEQKLESFPEQPTYYLAREEHYRKGIRQGKMVHYNWEGKITLEVNFKDGDPDGKMIERNKLISSVINYEEGLYDGIMQSHLTLPDKDSILLYDINFQNHQLQGESKAYHPNGKLAKRGFFLNNEPIEDYQAYDTLGKLYHYVKFMYSFPVEEKIWEENELSIRYQFDWRDSIYFRPSDITEIPSVEQLLYEYNLLGENHYDEPYRGRPSLINKKKVAFLLTKYYPDEVLAREGTVDKGKKSGCWKYYSTEGKKLYEIEYFDSILKINDSIRFKSKGIYYAYNAEGKLSSSSWLIEKIESYDCTHTDHYETRQFMTISCDTSQGPDRFNGMVRNYYDNGTLQSEGLMKNGLPSGVWKYFTPNGMMNQVGEYVQGKRNGRWLSGDLTKINYLGDICINPNAPDIEERIKYQENLIDIRIRYFDLGKIQKSEFYDLNLNNK